jgi:cytochrome P450
MPESEQTDLPPTARIPEQLQSREGQLNPFPYYDTLRDSDPVRYDPDREVWDVFRYEDVSAVIDRYETFSRSAESRQEGVAQGTMITADPPEHTRLRSVVEDAFQPANIRSYRPTFEEYADSFLEEALADGTQIEFVSDYAFRLPITAIAELLGVPEEDFEKFKQWSHAIESSPIETSEDSVADYNQTRQQALEDLWAFFRSLISDRREQPKDDIVSKIVHDEDADLTDKEIVRLCGLLLVAGNITTVNLISNSLWTFSEQGIIPDIQDGTVDLGNAIEEVLRYRSPIQGMSRTTKSDTVVRGQEISAGETMIIWLGAANRDPAEFNAPNQFRPERSPNNHMAFGGGLHYCLGAPLARVEAEVALRMFLERVSNVEIETESMEPLESGIFYGLESMPIEVEP